MGLTKAEKEERAKAQAVAKAATVSQVDMEEPDSHVVYYGNQPIFSSNDEEVCLSFASMKRYELIHSGVDVRAIEHTVEVREVELVEA